MPRLAQTLYDFIPASECLRVAEAVLRVFNASEEMRRNRMMARLKVLIERLGLEAFRRLVDEELDQPWAQRPLDPATFAWIPVEEGEAHRPQCAPASTNGHKLPKEFHYWRATNVVGQRQPGYCAVYIRLPLGDIQARQLTALAEIARRCSGGTVRTTQEQNLLLRWVREESLYDLWRRLSEVGLAEPDVHTITDIGACPGTDSCKLAITASMGLARAIMAAVESGDGLRDDPLVREVRIKVSGCPYGCSHYHLGQIGLAGAATKGPDGRQVPAYELFLGGYYGDGVVRYGRRIPGKVPAKRVPELVLHLLSFYRERRLEGEPFHHFVERLGIEPFAEMVRRFGEVGPLGRETLPLYMDWERKVLYRVERGEGECAT
jgi:sulfite reductase beta subunit-like hemoprotein